MDVMGLDSLLILGFGGIGLCYILMSTARKAKKLRSAATVRGTDTQVEFKEFKKKTAEDPENPKHWVQWGNALVLSARQARHLSLKLHRYNEACSCYARATEISQDYLPAWISWGVVLYELFRVQKKTDVLMLEGGHNKFHTAVDLAPKVPAIWKQWGEELNKVAASVGGDQKRALLEQARECLGKAADLEHPPAQTPDQNAPPDAGQPSPQDKQPQPVETAQAADLDHQLTITE